MFTTIPVECYAGSRGDETRRRFGTPGAQIEIAEAVDRWLALDHRYFKSATMKARCISCGTT